MVHWLGIDEDWDKYQAFGLGRAAVVQFSRGCPHTCTYCGQWMFWKRWRYRDKIAFVDELERLHREHQVNFFWLADENPTVEVGLPASGNRRQAAHPFATVPRRQTDRNGLSSASPSSLEHTHRSRP